MEIDNGILMATDSHFKPYVSQSIRTALKTLSERVKENFDTLGKKESFGDTRLSKISGRSYDGFWAHQDGGFEVNEMFRSDQDPSYHFTKGQTEYMNRLADDAWGNFLIDAKLDQDITWDALTEEQKDRFSEYESGYYDDGCLLRFECWKESHKGTVFIRLSLNYKDGPYFRSKHDDTLFEAVLTEAELSTKNLENYAEYIMSFA